MFGSLGPRPPFSSLNNLPPGPKMADQNKENPLHISWQDSMWIPHLNSANILEYFSERTNPFYSRDCNNEFIKMQQNTRVDQLTNMQGVEYMLLHTQEPILYIIRKQHRFSPTQVTPMANYHIIGGQVFQTPDLGSIVNSRVLATLSNLTSAFTELQSYSHYHPSRGYWWQFRSQSDQGDQQKKKEGKKATQTKKEEKASNFQNHRVNALLKDLHDKFPYKNPTPPQAPAPVGQQQTQSQVPTGQQQQSQNLQPQQSGPQQPQPAQQPDASKTTSGEETKPEVKVEIKTEIKQEPGTQPAPQRGSKPPPEKRQRTTP
ncbi:mediator of RNA polymerase II transcription subunit 6 [Macrobrachium rosenbergii]|uniref:mediator of RNA polymerase II transcription subunit 6 n=1 Tax=Macrobrachium rosenbergii TaxID=79674 RepID=UPI0034D683AA